MRIHALDLLVILAYAAVTLALGLRFSSRNRSTERYFLGARNFPGWAIGLSFIGSLISSVSFIAYPADSFKTAWLRILPTLSFPLLSIFAALCFIPFFRGGPARTAYHYLSLRFGPVVSIYAALIYIGLQIMRAAMIAYLLAIVLASVFGWPVGASIALSAGVTAIYTVKGGFEAVVWTDVIQTIVLLSGAIACVVFISHAIPGGLWGVLSEARAAGKISLNDLDVKSGQLRPAPLGFSLWHNTVPMLVLVGISNYLAGFLDQHSVQRWRSARSDGAARQSMLIVGLGAVPIWSGFMLLGSCLWVYYRHFPSAVSTAILAGTRKSEDILPHFIVTVLPPGLAGLVLSASLAAAMASLSSCISSTSMVWVDDLYRKHWVTTQSDAHYLRAGKAASIGIALLMSGGAYLFYAANGKTLMDVVLSVTSLLGGGLPGIFLLGMFTRLGDHRAALCGVAATVLFSCYALVAELGFAPLPVAAYYVSLMANLIMFFVTALMALVFLRRERDLTGLTVWTLQPRVP